MKKLNLFRPVFHIAVITLSIFTNCNNQHFENRKNKDIPVEMIDVEDSIPKGADFIIRNDRIPDYSECYNTEIETIGKQNFKIEEVPGKSNYQSGKYNLTLLDSTIFINNHENISMI